MFSDETEAMEALTNAALSVVSGLDNVLHGQTVTVSCDELAPKSLVTVLDESNTNACPPGEITCTFNALVPDQPYSVQCSLGVLFGGMATIMVEGKKATRH